MKTYIKPLITVIDMACTEMLATSLPVNKDNGSDAVITEPDEVLNKKSLWDENW